MTHTGKLWGKIDAGAPASYHPLLYHLLDAGSVCEALWDSGLGASVHRLMSEGFGLEPTACRSLVSFLTGLHDIGKACPGFQGRARELHPDLYRRMARQGLSFPNDPPVGHGQITAVTATDTLASLGVPRQAALELAVVLGGHHGVLPGPAELRRLRHRAGGDEWQAVRDKLAALIGEAFDVVRLPASLGQSRRWQACLMALAGLVTVSDWIASCEAFFPYDGDDMAVETYRDRSRRLARAAIQAIGWMPWSPDGALFN